MIVLLQDQTDSINQKYHEHLRSLLIIFVSRDSLYSDFNIYDLLRTKTVPFEDPKNGTVLDLQMGSFLNNYRPLRSTKESTTMVSSRRPKEIVFSDMSIQDKGPEYVKIKEEQYGALAWEDVDRDFVGIDEATELLGMKRSTYVRTLVLSSQLEGVRIIHRGYDKWFIERASIEWYKGGRQRRSTIKRMVLRIHPRDELEIRSTLERMVEMGTISEFTLEAAYTRKQKDEG